MQGLAGMEKSAFGLGNGHLSSRFLLSSPSRAWQERHAVPASSVPDAIRTHEQIEILAAFYWPMRASGQLLLLKRSAGVYAVVEVCHASPLDDPWILQLDWRTCQVVEEADAFAKQHGHEIHSDPIQ